MAEGPSLHVTNSVQSGAGLSNGARKQTFFSGHPNKYCKNAIGGQYFMLSRSNLKDREDGG